MHIGPHKTATTYIQHCFFRSTKSLADAGLVYPRFGIDLGNKTHKAHHDLAHNHADFLDADGSKNQQLMAFGKQVAESPDTNYVFSAEGFSRWPLDRYLNFADQLGQEKLSLAYFVRDPYDVFYSFWAEEVKQGYSASLTRRFAENFAEPYRSRLINPCVDLQEIAKHDRIELNLFFYDKIKAAKGDVFDTLCDDWLGVEGVEKPVKRPLNERFPIPLTEFIRLLTARKAQGKRHLGSALRLRFTRGTTRLQRRNIVKTINQKGAAARRVIKLPRNGPLIAGLEAEIRDNLGPYIANKLPDGPLFSRDEARWIHFDGITLSQVPEVAALLEETEKSLKLHEL